MIPKWALLKKPTETAPNINNGFDEFVNEARRSASIFVNCFSCLSLAVSFAPAGYPDAIPIAHAKPPTPGTRNNGLIKGSRSTPINLTTPNPINNSVTIKNGRREGKTISHHIFSPLIEASTDSRGKAINDMAIIRTISAKKIVFSLDRNTIQASPKGN